jgi:hypothetical protein
MKYFIFPAFLLLVIVSHTSAQGRFPVLDKSPMDMAYYPNNYPLLKIQDKVTGPLLARVIYSRPQRSGRNVFGELLEYNKVWRLGANEATEIEFFADMVIANKIVPKGKYTLYAIPNPDKWTIIVNRDTDTWGAFKYDMAKDVVRLDLPVEKLAEPLEAFSIVFEKGNNGGYLMTAGWDAAAVSLPITTYEKKSAVKRATKK